MTTNNDEHVVTLEEFSEGVMETLQLPKYAIRVTYTGFEPAFPGEIFVTYFRKPKMGAKPTTHPFVIGMEMPTLLASKAEAIRAARGVQKRMDLLEEKERLNDSWNIIGTVPGFSSWKSRRANREYFVRAVVYDPLQHAREDEYNKALIKKGQEHRENAKKAQVVFIDDPIANSAGKSSYMQKYYYDLLKEKLKETDEALHKVNNEILKKI